MRKGDSMIAIIGVDIGTTSIKAILYDEKKQIRAEASVSYPTYRPEPKQAEQNPEEIYQAFLIAVKEVTSLLKENETVSYVSFSSAMHSLIVVDEAGESLTNMLIWSDNRADQQVAAWKEEEHQLGVYQKTGTPLHPMSPFAKLLWMKVETDYLSQANKFIGIKEYIFYRLTGKYVVDYSIASATGLFNIQELAWDKDILETLELKETQLSKPVDVQSTFDFQSLELAVELGLTRKTKLIIGASDGCLANLGAGITEKGDLSLTIGTSGAVRMTVDEIYLDNEGRTFCYYLMPGKWVIGGAVNNGGNVLDWLDDLLFEKVGKIYQSIPTAFQKTEPGAEDLFFLPYINGERAPLWQGNLRGTFHGLSAFHTKNHLIRAALEGIMFNLKEVMEIVAEIGGEISKIQASGGFLQSKEWSQLAADILGVPIYKAVSGEDSALGAVLLVNNPRTKTEEKKMITPNATRQAFYQKQYQAYLSLRKKLI